MIISVVSITDEQADEYRPAIIDALTELNADSACLPDGMGMQICYEVI